VKRPVYRCLDPWERTERLWLDAQAGPLAGLLTRVCAVHGLRPLDVLGPSKEALLLPARREVWRVLRSWGWSYPAIGAATGRDHSTVMAALRATPKPSRRRTVREAVREALGALRVV
jgi:chromosomal replication initiation ATPase DnaA